MIVDVYSYKTEIQYPQHDISLYLMDHMEQWFEKMSLHCTENVLLIKLGLN